MNLLQQDACRAVVNVFETGKVRGDYAAVSVIQGDTGHLSYGRSQVSLGSGHLHKLLALYCQQGGAKVASDLRPLLPRFKEIDLSLDTDQQVKDLLARAGKEDPVMRTTQDQYFNQNFLEPACSAAETFGITSALGQTVVYDSHVQGGWHALSTRIGPRGARDEQSWVRQYVAMRRDWLLSRKPPVPATVYRMDSLEGLIKGGNFDLHLPFRVHGVLITAEALAGGETPAPSETARTLRPTTPYLRGDDVMALQNALNASNFSTPVDGVYGPFTDALVKKYQKLKGITENGVDKLTRKSLGLSAAAAVAAGQP